VDKVMVTIKLDRVEYEYEIIKHADTYAILEHGKEIAEIECSDVWTQTSGEHLPDGCIEEIIHVIEANYN
jgi:hypothetical protein